jgi:hypothetical protein
MSWKDRVITERDELKEKLDKLTDFLNSGKDKETNQSSLLHEQQKVMKEYLDILNERLL